MRVLASDLKLSLCRLIGSFIKYFQQDFRFACFFPLRGYVVLVFVVSCLLTLN